MPLTVTYRKQNSFVDIDAFPNCKTKVLMGKSLKKYLDKKNYFCVAIGNELHQVVLEQDMYKN